MNMQNNVWGNLMDSLQGKRQKQTYLARLARLEYDKARREKTENKIIKAIRDMNCECISLDISNAVGLSRAFTRSVLRRLENKGILETHKKKIGKTWIQFWIIKDAC